MRIARSTFLGLFFVCACAGSSQTAPPGRAPNPRFVVGDSVEMLGEPIAWFGSAFESRDDRRLYFGSLWRNRTSRAMRVAITYEGAYLADGTRLRGCSGPRGEFVLPGELAWIVCSPSSVPRRMPLPVTVIARNPEAVAVIRGEADILTDSVVWRETRRDRAERPFEIPFPIVYARARSHDVDASALFRLYDAGGVQLGTCYSQTATFHREASGRLRATGCPSRDALKGSVTRVEVSFER